MSEWVSWIVLALLFGIAVVDLWRHHAVLAKRRQEFEARMLRLENEDDWKRCGDEPRKEDGE